MAARNKRVRTPWLSYTLVAIGGVLMALPFLDMLFSSFKGRANTASSPTISFRRTSPGATTAPHSSSCSSATSSSTAWW